MAFKQLKVWQSWRSQYPFIFGVYLPTRLPSSIFRSSKNGF